MELLIVADNVRSIENIGALFRLADGVGASELVLIGISPYPDLGKLDTRRPWLKLRMTEKLKKTALSGMSLPFRYFETQTQAIDYLEKQGTIILALEQTEKSFWLQSLPDRLGQYVKDHQNLNKVALIVGHEVDGVSQELIAEADLCVAIPMYGNGKSLNVSVSAGIAAYAVRDCIDRL